MPSEFLCLLFIFWYCKNYWILIYLFFYFFGHTQNNSFYLLTPVFFYEQVIQWYINIYPEELAIIILIIVNPMLAININCLRALEQNYERNVSLTRKSNCTLKEREKSLRTKERQKESENVFSASDLANKCFSFRGWFAYFP